MKEKSSVKGIWQYCQIILAPKSELITYTRALTSANYDFITALSITVEFPVSDLVKLSKLVNLVALEIINPTTGQSLVSDFLVRAWSLSASEDEAFRILRILRLWNHKEITPKSVYNLVHFPSLVIYDVRGCFENCRPQKDSGWVYGHTRGSVFTASNQSQQKDIDSLVKILDEGLIKGESQRIRWDYTLHTLIKIVGRLGNNSDMKKFGVSIANWAVSNEKFITRVPTTYFHLGCADNRPLIHCRSWFVKGKLSNQDTTSSYQSRNLADINVEAQESLFKSQRPQKLKAKRKLHELLEEFS